MIRRTIALLAAAGMAGAAQAQVEVKGAWVRGMVETQNSTGAFMRITSKSPARLVGAQSPVAGVAEIHRSTMDGGVMRMRQVETIDLPAGKAVELRPGGYHIMLMQVARPLKEGEAVPLTLIVESGGGKRESVVVTALVKALTTPAGKHGGH